MLLGSTDTVVLGNGVCSDLGKKEEHYFFIYFLFPHQRNPSPVCWAFSLLAMSKLRLHFVGHLWLHNMTYSFSFEPFPTSAIYSPEMGHCINPSSISKHGRNAVFSVSSEPGQQQAYMSKLLVFGQTDYTPICCLRKKSEYWSFNNDMFTQNHNSVEIMLCFSLYYCPLRTIHTLISSHIPSDFPPKRQLFPLNSNSGNNVTMFIF